MYGYFIDIDLSSEKQNSFSLDDTNNIISNKIVVGIIDLVRTQDEYSDIPDDLYKSRSLTISNIQIAKSYRGNGCFNKTMQIISDLAKKYNFDNIFLRIDDDSEIEVEILRNLYEKHGFVDYDGDIQSESDDLFMVKKLGMSFDPENETEGPK